MGDNDTATTQFDVLLIELFPSSFFLILQILLIFKARFSAQEQNHLDEDPENLNVVDKNDVSITISECVHFKLSVLLCFLYLFDIFYAVFFDPESWWIPEDSNLIYLYLIPAVGWLISSQHKPWFARFNELFTVNLKFFWVLSFCAHFIQILTRNKYDNFLILLSKLMFTGILMPYALTKESKGDKEKGQMNSKFVIIRWMEVVIVKFEENFYVRVIFLGRDYERFLRKEIELSDIEVHSTMNMNLSFSDVKKREKAFVKKLTDKNYLNELEEHEFLSYLPSIQILIWKEPAKTLPAVLKNYDPRLFFVVYSYLTWDLDNRLEFRIYRKLSEFMELEKKLNEFYLENSYFNRQAVEFQRFNLEECENDEDLLYKKRALTLERFFNFVLLREKYLIHPLILDFLELPPEEKKPFQAYYNFLIKQKIIRNNRKNSNKRPRGALDSPLLTENYDDDIVSVSQSSNSIPLIPMNYLLFEVRLINIWKFPNEPLESNITMGITERNINYDWEITRKFSDFLELHMLLKTKPFKNQQDFEANTQKIAPLLQVKANTLNYFFNFEVIKKDLIDYITFLVSNSQFHCNEVFNFIEFDPNAMKRFVLGKNLNKFLAPTQTIRTFTNESHVGGRAQQHCSILSYAEMNSSLAFNTPPLSRINTNVGGGNNRNVPGLKTFTRTYTTRPNLPERKFEGLSERHHETLRLESFFAGVTEIKRLNENGVVFVICLNEYISEKVNKVKRRVIMERTKEEFTRLYGFVTGYCQENHIEMSTPLKNIDFLDETKEENVKTGVEIYLNEVIRLPNISKQKEVLLFFYFDKARPYFQDNIDQGMMMELDLRAKE